jgi:phytoene dehydrogenase-like protein
MRGNEFENQESKVGGSQCSAANVPGTTDPGANKKVIIIGGGIAGLSCGCYLQMNGYQTEILEANTVPGGLCVAWDRGPYVFDGCLRWLVGTNPSSSFHHIWNELGAIDGRPILDHDEFLRVEGADGQVLSLSCDLDQLARDFKRIAPEDSALIDNLMRAARRCASLEPPEQPLELMSGLEKMKLLARYFPMLPTLARWKNREFAAYVATYRNPFLRQALMAVVGDVRMSALVLVMVLGFRSRKNAGYVAGGSRAFARAVADRYDRLGGVLRYRTQVASVTVKNSRATGVKCADGTAIPASTVVSCADGRTTLFKMLEGRYLNKQLRYAYAHFEVFPALFQASLGVNRTFPEAPRELSLALSRPLMVDDATRHDRLEVAVFGCDSGLCPAGKSILIVRFAGSFDYWTKLKQHQPDDYAQAKQKLLQEVIGILDQRFPELARHIEYTDLATPATFERFTGNWQGSIQGWLPTPRILGRRFPRTLPGLKDFFMAGHWVEPGGGLPSAALSGKYVAQMICARDGREFAATVA